MKWIDKFFQKNNSGSLVNTEGSMSYCAYLYEEMSEYELAINEIMVHVEKGKANTHHYNNLGVINCEINNEKQGIEYLKKAIELDPNNPIPYKNLGMIEERKGHLEHALNYYTKALSNNPDDYSVNLNNGYVLMKMDRPKEAIGFFLKAIDMGFDNEIVHEQLAKAYKAIGDKQNVQNHEQLANIQLI